MSDLISPDMSLSEPAQFPAVFQEACQVFLQQYYEDRRWEMQEYFGYYSLAPLEPEQLQKTMLAESLAYIAKAAAGELDRENAMAADEEYGACQTLAERLFAAPGLGSAYRIPPEFWESPVGEMVALAFVWYERDELISMSQASEISGRSLSDLSNMVDRGKLRSYPDPKEPNRTKRGRLLRSEVERLPEKRTTK